MLLPHLRVRVCVGSCACAYACVCADIYEFLLLVQKCKADQGDLPGADESKACSIM